MGTASGIGVSPSFGSLAGPADPSAGHAFYYDPKNTVFRSGSTVITGPSAEMVTNGAFASDITGWSNSGSTAGSWSAGKLRATQTVSMAGGGVYQDVGAVRAGQSFRIQGSQVSSDGSHGRVRMEVSGNSLAADSGTTVIGTGSFDFVVTAPFPGTLRINLETANTGDYGNAGVYCEFDDVSITQVSLSMQLPGATYTRTGAKSELNASGSPVAFAANVPGEVPGEGYWARGAVTNLLLYSQAFDDATWAKVAGLTVAANNATARDGTLTADTATNAGNGYLRQQIAAGISAGATYTYVADVRATAVSGAANIRLTTNNTAAWGTGVSTKFPLTTSWQRCIVVGAVSTGTAVNCMIGAIDASGTDDATCSGNFEIRDAQLMLGNFPDGGPIIPTAGATQALGLDDLRFSLAASDVDCLVYLHVNAGKWTATNCALFEWSAAGASANRLTLYSSANNLVSYFEAAGALVHNVNMVGALTDGDDHILIIRRLSGNYRIGTYKSGTLTWAAADAAGAWPTGLSRIDIGTINNGGTAPPESAKDWRFKVKEGAFTTDAAVIAQVTA